ncbi:MAG TPA: DUF3828 domain-containing protein [Pyrinomonadaceae bacterium]|jgi:hypothetical protein|nr:DUF3828 domain-containing protein [Pyrinomonadaceae bacterium]
MKSVHKPLVFIVLLAWCSAPPARAQGQRRAPAVSPRQTAQSFYRFHFAHGMDFTERNLRQRRRWLTAELYDLLRDEFRKEAERAKAHPDEAPFIEGDPFTDSQEYPKSFRVGNAISSGGSSVVHVTLVWVGRAPHEREERAVSVTMRRVGARWLIGNIKSAGGEDLLTLLRKPRE